MTTSEQVVDPNNIGYWANRWTEKKIGWHQNDVDKYLLKYYPQITGKNCPETELLSKESPEFKENSTKTWFVPLSGKTLDIPFLLNLGYNVFGVDGVRQAIEELDTEHALGLTLDESSSVFVGAEGRLRIYFGDLFQCPIEAFGPFDYVWDRGSLIAIEYSCRKNYKTMMQRALKQKDGTCKSIYEFSDRGITSDYNFVYLLEAVRYNKTKFGGPPRCLDEEDIEAMYGDWAEVKFLEKAALPETHPVSRHPDIGPVSELVFLITPK